MSLFSSVVYLQSRDRRKSDVGVVREKEFAGKNVGCCALCDALVYGYVGNRGERRKKNNDTTTSVREGTEDGFADVSGIDWELGMELNASLMVGRRRTSERAVVLGKSGQPYGLVVGLLKEMDQILVALTGRRRRKGGAKLAVVR